MRYAVIWWIILELIGWATFPLAFRLFRHLPDRGCIFAKPLGLLLGAYLFWLLAMLGVVQNTWGSIFFSFVLIVGLGIHLYVREGRRAQTDTSLGTFLRTHWRLVLFSEMLFLAGFALWTFYRAYNPEISATEKPMEFAFLNGILRSERFPPLDPWLSGFGISYYYFGYVMMAVLTRLSGVPSSVAFNLGIALLFAWTLVGSFSVVYNLIAGFRPNKAPNKLTAVGFGLLGAWTVTIAGNLEGLFEVLHTRGIGSLAFWNWLDVKNLVDAPISGSWIPTDNWWWWRASRVIHDRDPLGRSMEVIDEFPFFSFMLGDMHPHVLALPFVLLALGLALNLVLAVRHRRLPIDETSGLIQRLFGEDWPIFLLYGVCIGAIGFLNTWDLPIYFLILMGAYAIRRYAERGLGWLTDTVRVAVLLGVLSLALYLPFYVTFQSQAGGLLPELLVSTRLRHYLLMFGLQLFLVASFLVARYAKFWRDLPSHAARLKALGRTLYLWIGLMVLPGAAMLGITLPLFFSPRGREFLEGIRNNEAVRQLVSDGGWSGVLFSLVARRLNSPWTPLVLALVLAVGMMLLLVNVHHIAAKVADGGATEDHDHADLSSAFALWIALVGLLLTYIVEFVYLRDTFGTRMNTVFKFYYQGWLLMSISGVFGLFYIFQGRGRAFSPMRIVWSVGLTALFLLSAIYPILAGYSKAEEFRSQPTLDGTAYMAIYNPNDYAAIRWMNENIAGAPVILEAYGGSYSAYARVSAQTGLPTVLGWSGHELQWRGNYEEPGKREPDIDQIYGGFDRKLTLTLLDKYGISYVYVGSLERQKYPSSALAKFDQLLTPVYRRGTVTIYRRDR